MQGSPKRRPSAKAIAEACAKDLLNFSTTVNRESFVGRIAYEIRRDRRRRK